MTDPRSLDRRTLFRMGAGALAATGAVAGAVAASPSAAAAGRDGTGRVPRGGISIQLFTLRSILAEDLEGTLAALADIGYRKVELAGTHGRSAAEFRAILDRHGLRATSSHVGIDGDFQRTLEDANILGQRFLCLPFADPGDADGYRRLAEQLNEAGEAARAAGLRFGYHNHAHEFQVVEGDTRGYDILVAETDRRLVHLQLDLYWAVAGGADPVVLFNQAGGRFLQFHVKDMAPDGGFADPGEGVIDFGRIFEHARRARVLEYIVENDQPVDALETARIGWSYLRNLRY